MLGTRILENTTSQYNKNIKVVRSWGLGTYIQVNGLTQSGGIVENIWLSTLKFVKKRFPKIKTILILGLGGGTLVKVSKKYFPESKITGVEIDKKMVELGKKYLDLNDAEVIIKDAINYKSNQKFDLVIVDLYTGDEFPKKFESDSFLRSLTKHGLVIFNRLYYKEKILLADSFKNKLENLFSEVVAYKPQANIIFICRR